MKRSIRLAAAAVVVSGACALCLGATRAEARPVAPATATVVQATPFGAITSFIFNNLTGSLAGTATDAVLGTVLSAIGLGDDTGAQLAAISAKLDQINSKLDALSNQVTQVLVAVQQGTCANLSGQLDQTRSKIDVAWHRYQKVTGEKSPVVRKKMARNLLAYLASHLDYEAAELEIHNKLVNPGAGAIGLVTACGQAVQSPSGLLTAKSALPVRQILDFWQAYEAKLLVLQIESLAAHGQKAAAREATAAVKRTLQQELATLRPAVPKGYFYDKSTQRLWLQAVPLHTTYLDASAYASKMSKETIKKWHIPTETDITGLAQRCCPGALTPSTSLSPDDPAGLQDFYGALVRRAGAAFEPVAGTGYANQISAGGGKIPDRNHIPPVLNGFSNIGLQNIGGYVLIWYRVPNAAARYGY